MGNSPGNIVKLLNDILKELREINTNSRIIAKGEDDRPIEPKEPMDNKDRFKNDSRRARQ